MGYIKKFLSLTLIKQMKHEVDRKELEPKQDKIKKRGCQGVCHRNKHTKIALRC